MRVVGLVTTMRVDDDDGNDEHNCAATTAQTLTLLGQTFEQLRVHASNCATLFGMTAPS